MNRKQRKLKHRRRIEASKPGRPREDIRVTWLDMCLEKARKARKGRAYVVKLMAEHGYIINDDADHKVPGNWHPLPAPKPALVKS